MLNLISCIFFHLSNTIIYFFQDEGGTSKKGILINSEVLARASHPYAMGIYKELSGQTNGAPAFKHLVKNYFLYKDKEGHWVISQNLGDAQAYITTVTNKAAYPTDARDWSFFDGTNWNRDWTLQASLACKSSMNRHNYACVYTQA